MKLNSKLARRFTQTIGTLAKTDRIDDILLARMAVTLHPPVRPARRAAQTQIAELINARDGVVRDRTALKNLEKNLAIAFLKRQCRQRLEQIDRHIEALDAEISDLIAADAVVARRNQILISIAGVGTLAIANGEQDAVQSPTSSTSAEPWDCRKFGSIRRICASGKTNSNSPSRTKSQVIGESERRLFRTKFTWS